MPNFYTYLISTLPMLHFGMRPPFAFERFISQCQRLIPDADIGVLEKTSITGDYAVKDTQSTLKKWYNFDTALRNELVKIRAIKKHVDPTRYLRQEKFTELSIIHLAMNATRSPSILEAEKMLDQERWKALDDFSFGHYFDLDFLIIYALKLLILERWERIDTSNKAQVLEETLEEK